MIKLIFFAGSIREESINKKLSLLAANIAKNADIEVLHIDLKDYSMPLYNGDYEVENGIPENAKTLKDIFAGSHGFFIASPEYNGSFSPLLKNTIDWISRPHEENEINLRAFSGKVAALGAASPGRLGGLRGLIPLKMLLGNIGVTVTPTQVAIDSGFQAFSKEGRLKDIRHNKLLNSTIEELINITQKIYNNT